MAICLECEASVDLPFTCKFCGGKFCPSHRLPENHNCFALIRYKEQIRSSKARKIVYAPSKLKKEIKFTFNDFEVIPQTYWSQAHRYKNYSKYIIGLCVIIFILYYLPGTSTFLQYLELVPVELGNRPWTIVTYIFLHRDLLHLVFNMFVLYNFGPLLEQRVGSTYFLVIFLIAGILSGLIGAIFTSVKDVHAIGASGSIMGVIGCIGVLMPNTHIVMFIYIFPFTLKLIHAVGLLILLNLFFNLAETDNISYVGHLGGILTGMLYGIIAFGALQIIPKRKNNFMYLTTFSIIIAAIIYFSLIS